MAAFTFEKLSAVGDPAIVRASAVTSSAAGKPHWFTVVIDAMVESRMRQADWEIRSLLQTTDHAAKH